MFSHARTRIASEAALETINRLEVTVLASGMVSRHDAAAFLGRSPKTLAMWAWRGVGPSPRSINGRAFYDFSELRSFARGGAKQVAA